MSGIRDRKRLWQLVVLPLVLYLLACSDEPGRRGKRRTASVPRVAYHGHNSDFPLQAVSLAAVQQRLASCTSRKTSCPAEAQSLGGLTRLLGYTVDAARHDIVLLGLMDPAAPPIHTADFVIALRNAWFRYAPLKGNVREYSYPGCDIRPSQEAAQQLKRLDKEISSHTSPASFKSDAENWRRACRLEQRVSVIGVPHDSHFGNVMVTADYHMKKLADGSDDPAIPGLASLSDLRMAEARQSVLEGRSGGSGSSMNRFWLTPGESEYAGTKDTFFLQWSPVQVRTHSSGIDAAGNVRDTERTDALAEDFALRFSLLYEQVAQRRPVYRELESLFHLVALAKAMHGNQADRSAGLSLGYLLYKLPLSKQSVPREVPGWPRVREFQHRQKIPGGVETIYLQMPSCGGVDIRIEPEHVQPLSSEQARLRDNVLRNHPQNAIAWPVAVNPVLQTSLQTNRRLRRINRTNKPLVLVVEDAGSAYRLHDGTTSVDYADLDVSKILQRASDLARGKETSSIYIETKGFSADRKKAFDASCRVQLTRMGPNFRLHALHDIPATITEVLTYPSVRIELPTGPAERLTVGPYRGFWSNAYRVAKGSVKVTLTVIARSAEVLDRFFELLGFHPAVAESLPFSWFDVTDQVWRDLKKEYPNLKDDELLILIQEQTGSVHSVAIESLRKEAAA
jgi:hypothetical protein